MIPTFSVSSCRIWQATSLQTLRNFITMGCMKIATSLDYVGTIANSAALLHQEGAREVYACCTHAVFRYGSVTQFVALTKCLSGIFQLMAGPLWNILEFLEGSIAWYITLYLLHGEVKRFFFELLRIFFLCSSSLSLPCMHSNKHKVATSIWLVTLVLACAGLEQHVFGHNFVFWRLCYCIHVDKNLTVLCSTGGQPSSHWEAIRRTFPWGDHNQHCPGEGGKLLPTADRLISSQPSWRNHLACPRRLLCQQYFSIMMKIRITLIRIFF